MKKPTLMIGGIIVLVLLLAGAAFVGGRLLSGQGLPGLAPSQSVSVGPNGKMQLDIEPAKELPQTPGDVFGVFDHRKDNSIFVGTGEVTMEVSRDQQISTSHSGPIVEVVVSTQTKIYKDVTMNQFSDRPPEGQKIQQVLEPGSLDDIGQSSSIIVWGRKTGDRFIADILVVASPPAFKTRNSNNEPSK
jgi:hypothetical protein